jgi:hypothetical protein
LIKIKVRFDKDATLPWRSFCAAIKKVDEFSRDQGKSRKTSDQESATLTETAPGIDVAHVIANTQAELVVPTTVPELAILLLARLRVGPQEQRDARVQRL